MNHSSLKSFPFVQTRYVWVQPITFWLLMLPRPSCKFGSGIKLENLSWNSHSRKNCLSLSCSLALWIWLSEELNKGVYKYGKSFLDNWLVMLLELISVKSLISILLWLEIWWLRQAAIAKLKYGYSANWSKTNKLLKTTNKTYHPPQILLKVN